jgi:carbon storage regulator
MLVLTRRVGEKVVIDGDIQLVVVAVQGEKVRLGISAPLSVRVDRQEVHQRRAEFDAPLVTRAGTDPVSGGANGAVQAAADPGGDSCPAWTTEWQS